MTSRLEQMGLGLSETNEAGMSYSAIEVVLVELAAVAEEVIAQAEAAEARMDELDDAREALIEQRAADVSHGRPQPQHAIVSLRSELATNAARDHRNAAREFAAWWADVATIAVLAAVTGQHVHPARVAAADPTIWFDDEDLRHLPEVAEGARELTRLAATMAATPLGAGQPDQTMAALANDHAAHAGLRINYADDGQIVVEQDRTSEARRRQLWGDTWIEARVPALPAPNELADLLTNDGAPASTVAAVSEAARAVDDAVTALRQVQAIEEGGIADAPVSADDKADWDSLWRHAEQLTALLGRYARTLMNALPVLQAGKQPQ